MSDRITQEQYDALPWLHVYGQYSYHSPARIVGTPAGLKSLRDAIDAALNDGSAKADAIASDGEGYDVEIERLNLIASLGTPQYLYQLGFPIAGVLEVCTKCGRTIERSK